MSDVSLAPGTVVTNRNPVWRVDALSYNALAVARPEIQRLAEERRRETPT